jgi:energy-converting hydrogenase Eha subunit G
MDKSVTETSEDGFLYKCFKAPWELFILIVVGVAMLSAYGGYKAAQMELHHGICSNYQTKHAEWRGWLSVKDGVYRCFWVESEYPWRLRHGVAKVE